MLFSYNLILYLAMLYTKLRAFDAVARAGSFSAAATVLGVSQPALSIQVKALEVAYEVLLFERRGRGLRLTQAGRDLHVLARQLLDLERDIEDALTKSKLTKRQRLRLAIDGPHITMPIVARFRALEPDIDVEVTLGNTRTVRRQLLERQVDLAILPRIAGDARVHVVPLKHHEGSVIVGRGHAWFGRQEVSAHELAEQGMVSREAGSNTQRAIDQALARVGVKPRVVLKFDSREAVKEAVAANLGFAILWKSEAEGDDRLNVIKLVGAEVRSVDYLACLKDSFRRRAVARFFSAALEA